MKSLLQQIFGRCVGGKGPQDLPNLAAAKAKGLESVTHLGQPGACSGKLTFAELEPGPQLED